MPYPTLDRSGLRLLPLSDRQHDMTLADVLPLDAPPPAFDHVHLDSIVDRRIAARHAGRPVIALIGAHVIKSGLSLQLIDLLERGLLTHSASNGAMQIHDRELALIGATAEAEGAFPHRHVSVLAAGVRLGVPVTIQPASATISFMSTPAATVRPSARHRTPASWCSRGR